MTDKPARLKSLVARLANTRTLRGIETVVYENRFLERRTPEVEVTKALAALQPLYGKDNIEVITAEASVRGRVQSLKMTQALTRPSVKIERADGEIIKVEFDTITEIVDHNPPADGQDSEAQSAEV